MCDIYIAECKGCGRKLEIHIGDFSAKREEVTVYCPVCIEKHTGITTANFLAAEKKFKREVDLIMKRKGYDKCVRQGLIEEKLSRKISNLFGMNIFIDEIKGKHVAENLTHGFCVFICSNPKGCGISLNGDGMFLNRKKGYFK